MRGIVFLCLLLGMYGCKDPDKIPRDVLSKKQMEALLIDIHTLEGGLLVLPSAVSAKDGYNSIFKKHHVTAEQYEKSVQFYRERPHLLVSIYEAIRDTFEKRMAK